MTQFEIDHPIMPGTIDAAELNGDDGNASGVNWAIWPDYFDSFETTMPLILTSDMLDVFVKECPDYTPPCQNNTMRVPWVDREIVIKEVA